MSHPSRCHSPYPFTWSHAVKSYAMKTVHFALGRLLPVRTMAVLSRHPTCGCAGVRRGDIRLALEITGCTGYGEPWVPCLEAWEVTHTRHRVLPWPDLLYHGNSVSHPAGQSLVSWLLVRSFPTPSCDCCPHCIQPFSFLSQFSQG